MNEPERIFLRPDACPYCRSKTNTNNYGGAGRWVILCGDFGCQYSSGNFDTEAEAIAAHNEVCRNHTAAPKLRAENKKLKRREQIELAGIKNKYGM